MEMFMSCLLGMDRLLGMNHLLVSVFVVVFFIAACAEDSRRRPGNSNDGGIDGSEQIICGNGIVEEGEECDDGNLLDGDGCSPVCTVEDGWACEGSPSVCENLCGNGTIDSGEQCDGDSLGGNNCSTIPGGYTGGTLKCNASCFFDTTECILPSCGNGIIDEGEECDNGEQNSTNGGCLPNCREAFCGDGYAWEGVEECDDGDTSNNDACLNNCEDASCGDGYVWEDIEECDDGALNSNTLPNACRSDCTSPRCGDGVVDSGEECDDGNEIAGDGCSPGCMTEELHQIHSISTLSGGWTMTPITYAGKPHAPTQPIVAAANVQTRGEAFVFTQDTYHVLSLTGLEWVDHGALTSKFTGATGANITCGYGVSWSHADETSIVLIEGEWARIYYVDNSTRGVSPDEDNPRQIDWSDKGDSAPQLQNIKANWLSLENDEGWTSFDPRDLCETTATEIGPYSAYITTLGSVHLIDVGHCWKFYAMMPLGDFPPFGVAGAPAAADIVAAFYVSPSLYVITAP